MSESQHDAEARVIAAVRKKLGMDQSLIPEDRYAVEKENYDLMMEIHLRGCGPLPVKPDPIKSPGPVAENKPAEVPEPPQPAISAVPVLPIKPAAISAISVPSAPKPPTPYVPTRPTPLPSSFAALNPTPTTEPLQCARQVSMSRAAQVYAEALTHLSANDHRTRLWTRTALFDASQPFTPANASRIPTHVRIKRDEARQLYCEWENAGWTEPSEHADGPPGIKFDNPSCREDENGKHGAHTWTYLVVAPGKAWGWNKEPPAEFFKSKLAGTVQKPIPDALLQQITVRLKKAAEMLGVSVSFLKKLIRSGRFGPKPIRLERVRLFRVDELKAWVVAGCPDAATWQAKYPPAQPSNVSIDPAANIIGPAVNDPNNLL